MKDEIKLADEKIQIQKRINRVINGLRRHLVHRADVNVLDRLSILVSPGLAYKEEGRMALSFIRDLNRSKAQVPEKLAVVFHEAAHLLLRFWELIRTDQTVGLYTLLDHLEGYAKTGLDECELLGGPSIGYSLFNRAVQREGE